MLPFLSLDSVSSTGPGEVLDLGSDPVDHFTVQLAATVVPTGSWELPVILQASLDGVSWFSVDQLNSGVTQGSPGQLAGSSAQSSAAQWYIAGNYGGTSLFPLARYLRLYVQPSANLSSFTVTGLVLAGNPT
jgi:hypothetical protein